MDMQVAFSSITVANQTVATALEAYRIQNSSFEAGKATIDDLLNAEAALLNARLVQIRILSSYYRSKVRVFQIRGNVTVNELAGITRLK